MTTEREQEIKALELCIKKNKKNSDLYAKLGKLYLDNNDYKNAIKNYEKAEKLGFSYFNIYTERSHIYTMVKKFQKALIYADKAIEKAPDNNYVYCHKGWVYEHMEDFINAKKYYMIANKKGFQGKDFRATIARCDYWLNKISEALESYKQLEEECVSSILWIYMKKEQYENALIYNKKLYEIDNNLERYYIIQGDIYDKIKEFEKAQDCYLEAEKIKAQNYFFYVRLSHFNSQLKNYEKSIEYAKKAIEMEPSGYCYSHIGCIYEDMGDNKKALKNFLKAEKLGWNDSCACSKIAYQLYLKKDYKKALKYATKSFELDSNNSYAKNLINDIEEKIK